MDPKIIKKWRDTLADLLEEARAEAQNDSLDARLAVADSLHDFIMNNPPSLPDQPETAEFDEMDAIARKAHDGLLLDGISGRVAAIMSQTAELAALTKKVQGQTAANQQAAKSIQLEKAQKVIASVTDTVNALKDLKTQIENQPLTDDGLAALAKKLGKVMETLQDLRTEVEGTG